MIGGVGWNGREPVYPQSGARFTGQTGRTLTSLYLFNEAAGNLIDVIAAQDLPPANAPTYGFLNRGQQGIRYAAGGSRNAADVNNTVANSFIAFGVFSNLAAVANAGLMGRENAAFAEGWRVYDNAVGTIAFEVEEATGGALAFGVASSILLTRKALVSFQYDRSAPGAEVCRARISCPGVAPAFNAANAFGFGSLSGAAQAYGFGSSALLPAGAAAYYGGIEIGATAAGATALRDLHRSLGWE